MAELQAIQQKKLFLLDDHDAIIPYLRRINSTTSKAYATRTILLLKTDGTLKPLAIELSLPHPQGDQYGAISNVYLPAEEGVESYIWLLAKAYVVVNDSNYHQLISHWYAFSVRFIQINLVYIYVCESSLILKY